jgi:hypothetical protein
MQDATIIEKRTRSENMSFVTQTLCVALKDRKALGRRDLTPKTVARFHQKYQIQSGCWPWMAGKFPTGYGMVNLGRYADGRQHTTYAHRVAFVLAHGDIPSGPHVVMHTCDDRGCVNPAHLQLGSQADNLRDAAKKGRHSSLIISNRWAARRRSALVARQSRSAVDVAKAFGVHLKTVWRWDREARQAAR